jgi:hypothetical protein
MKRFRRWRGSFWQHRIMGQNHDPTSKNLPKQSTATWRVQKQNQIDSRLGAAVGIGPKGIGK